MDDLSTNTVGFVAIGRNEGDRLKASLQAIKRFCPKSPVVYVDSGSTDDSCALARELGIEVVDLDMSVPFTAARARNAGFRRLMELAPSLSLVQFFDGDCEMVDGWMEAAIEAIAAPDVAIVSGRRTEKDTGFSVYNALIDIEWDTPVGETQAVLGDMLVKVQAFNQVDGFKEDVIAGEDYDFLSPGAAAWAQGPTG